MRGFVILLLGVIFVALITSSLPSIAVDDSGGNNVVSEDADKLNVVPTKSPKYKIYLHVIVRNAQDQFVSVSETMDGGYFAHEITDYAFDHSLPLVSGADIKSDATVLPPTGKKEIIIIDNMKYQKVHLTQIKNVQQMTLEGVRYDDIQSKWFIEYCVETNEQCDWHIAFATLTSHISLEEDDVVTIHWTVLRAMN